MEQAPCASDGSPHATLEIPVDVLWFVMFVQKKMIHTRERERGRDVYIYIHTYIYIYSFYCSRIFPLVYILQSPPKLVGYANPYNQFKVVGHHISTVNHLGFMG